MGISKESTRVDMRIMQKIVETFGNLAGRRFFTYITLLEEFDEKTKCCSIPISTIVKRTKLSERTINRVLNDLEMYGFILRQSGKGGASNKYWLPLEDELYFNPEASDFLEAKEKSLLYRTKVK